MSEYIIDLAAHNVNAAMALCDGVHEEIVRCRDCKEYRASDDTCHSWQWHNWDAPIEVDPDGFCAWGERRSDDQ